MFGLYEVQPVTRMVIEWESVDDDRWSVEEEKHECY
jgi:hypothetical protein